MCTLFTRQVCIAVMVAIAFNVAGLALMVEINHRIIPRSDPDNGQVEMVRFEPREKPKRRARFSIDSSRLREVRAALPLPTLPAAMPLKGERQVLESDIDLLGDMLGRDAGFEGELIFKEEAVDAGPEVMARVEPRYPPQAEARRIEGHVTFKLRISSLGRVEEVWVLESDPAGIFDTAADRAVRQYRFSPARHRGAAVAVIATQRIDFRLGDSQ